MFSMTPPPPPPKRKLFIVDLPMEKKCTCNPKYPHAPWCPKSKKTEGK